jgi:hypothetical protein
VQAVDLIFDDSANAGTMTMTWALAAVNAGTNVHIRADARRRDARAKENAGLALAHQVRPRLRQDHVPLGASSWARAGRELQGSIV